MNLAGVDLNLLVVFDALMVERNTTRAGERIGMSQPAVSKALNRLRYLCHDELFVRSPDGMQPTPRAVELSGPVQQALQQISNALEPGEFDPLMANRSFRLIANDLIVRLFMPAVMAHLDTEAPNIELHISSSLTNVLDRLEKSEADMAILSIPPPPDPFESAVVIHTSESVLLMREGHELSTGDLTRERLQSARFIGVSQIGGPQAPYVGLFDPNQMQRQIALSIDQVIAGPAIVAASELVMIVPRRLAAYQASFQNVMFRELPDLPNVAMPKARLVWHKRLNNNRPHVWLRDLLIEVGTERPRYSRREYSE
ncbi:MAG: hypothetical protein CMK09_05260 [Ponticaulis sp.]|nr:hypothetical protein [Ponticaulis sp.]|tara:strand:- start:23215 stop:24153 length:939 start_codon:yes stop_codon:yes gene_type:complete